jgi:hypothetical protein
MVRVMELLKIVLASLLVMALPAAVHAGPSANGAVTEVADRACHALRSRIDEFAGTTPIFLRSYDGPAGAGAGAEPALGGAFTYDNALAAIALHACGDDPAARRIADGLLAAAESDRSGVTGRLRNAYRAGPVTERPVPPMGWWSDQDRRWEEDPYQVGSATGNMAWAALALLTLADATHDRRYRDGAAKIAKWVIATAYAAQPPAGFDGGLYGYDDMPVRLTWKSTEHNIDMAAVFDWLARLDPRMDWASNARISRDFVASQWEAANGRFCIGTLPDGQSPNRVNQGLDAQLWPLLLSHPLPEWRNSIHFVARAFGVKGGFDFNDDRDGVWLEGTAQAALVYRALGRESDAERLFSTINAQFSPGGLVWATDIPRLTTGLSLSPDSSHDDFYYYRLPHLGATAWAALAALGWDPFTGAEVTALHSTP